MENVSGAHLILSVNNGRKRASESGLKSPNKRVYTRKYFCLGFILEERVDMTKANVGRLSEGLGTLT